MSGDTYTPLNLPSTGTPTDINDADDVVGSYFDTKTHGFVLSGGVLTTLDIPGSDFVRALGINDAGDIVGFYRDAADVAHGFLATPVPEPATVMLLAIGTLGIISWAWWRRMTAI